MSDYDLFSPSLVVVVVAAAAVDAVLGCERSGVEGGIRRGSTNTASFVLCLTITIHL